MSEREAADRPVSTTTVHVKLYIDQEEALEALQARERERLTREQAPAKVLTVAELVRRAVDEMLAADRARVTT